VWCIVTGADEDGDSAAAAAAVPKAVPSWRTAAISDDDNDGNDNGDGDDDDDVNDDSWMRHSLRDESFNKFDHVGIDPQLDPNTLSLEDPRNPLNQRRREAMEKSSKGKHRDRGGHNRDRGDRGGHRSDRHGRSDHDRDRRR
jgi:hypothetical protein